MDFWWAYGKGSTIIAPITTDAGHIQNNGNVYQWTGPFTAGDFTLSMIYKYYSHTNVGFTSDYFVCTSGSTPGARNLDVIARYNQATGMIDFFLSVYGLFLLLETGQTVQLAGFDPSIPHFIGVVKNGNSFMFYVDGNTVVFNFTTFQNYQSRPLIFNGFRTNGDANRMVYAVDDIELSRNVLNAAQLSIAASQYRNTGAHTLYGNTHFRQSFDTGRTYQPSYDSDFYSTASYSSWLNSVSNADYVAIPFGTLA